MASMKQLFSTLPGQCHLSSKRHHSNMKSECDSFHLALGGQTSSYACTTRGSMVINNFRNNPALLFLLFTGSSPNTGNTMSLLKMEILTFVSVTYKRRCDTSRIWPHKSQYSALGDKGCHFHRIIPFAKEEAWQVHSWGIKCGTVVAAALRVIQVK